MIVEDVIFKNMARIELNDFSEEKRKKIIGELYDSLAQIRDRDQAREVFRDLLTVSEITMLSRRIQIAFMLLEDYTYEEIQKVLNVSHSTIQRVGEKLQKHGKGFEIMYENFKRIQNKRWQENKYKEPLIPLSMSEVVQSNKPMHSIMDLVNWMKRRKESEKD